MKQFFRRGHAPFLFSEVGIVSFDEALFHVIPVPLERSVSYGKGTGAGPGAILEASQQLEIFDSTGIPAERGIHTRPYVSCRGKIEDVLERVAASVAESAMAGKVPIVLGGEHTVTAGAVRAFAEKRDFGIVQFDAHADLRQSYEGDAWSHASVIRRVYESGIPFMQVGVRSLSPGEVAFRREAGIFCLDADLLHRDGVPEKILPADFPREIYISFDVDGLDPSVIRATGTPEPGGVSWHQAMTICERLSREARIIGFDVVELAPRRGDHASDFAAARLVYNLMGYACRSI